MAWFKKKKSLLSTATGGKCRASITALKTHLKQNKALCCMSALTNLSELRELLDLLVIQRTVLPIVLTDEVLWKEMDGMSFHIPGYEHNHHIPVASRAARPRAAVTRKYSCSVDFQVHVCGCLFNWALISLSHIIIINSFHFILASLSVMIPKKSANSWSDWSVILSGSFHIPECQKSKHCYITISCL